MVNIYSWIEKNPFVYMMKERKTGRPVQQNFDLSQQDIELLNRVYPAYGTASSTTPAPTTTEEWTHFPLVTTEDYWSSDSSDWSFWG